MLDIAVKKLKEVYDHDPAELFLQGTTTCASEMHCGLFTFGMAFGADAVWVGGGGIHCGSGAHEIGGFMHASWSLVPDFKMCNYAIYFGASKGTFGRSRCQPKRTAGGRCTGARHEDGGG